MNMNFPKEKTTRILDIFFRLFKGETISVSQLANEYEVSTKSVSRDISQIKIYLSESRDSFGNAELKYSYQQKAYYLEFDRFLLQKELMAIVKVLIGARAFSKEELSALILKLKAFTSPGERRQLNELIKNEMYHYQEVYHDCDSVIDHLWQLINAIDKRAEITVTYFKQDRNDVKKRLKPVAVLFSEYYFYLLAYVEEDESNPHYFRIDRITNIVEHRTKFTLSHPFDEGQLKERIHYMYPGVYRKIRFSFSGPSVQAVLDKIPTARIIKQDGNVSILEACVYGKGINMFLLSQGSWIKVLEPKEYVDEIRKEVSEMYHYYME